MPNMWGDKHPWEIAGLTHAQWMEVLAYSIKRWTRSAQELQAMYRGGGAGLTLEEWRKRHTEHDDAQKEHFAVFRDADVCLRIWERIESERGKA